MNTRAAAVKILNSLRNNYFAYEKRIADFVGEKNFSQQDQDYIYALVKGAIQHQSFLDFIIDIAVTRSAKKLEITALNLLRIGILQISIMATPMHAAVNETVRAARQLKRLQLVPFINGVLRNLPPEEKWREALERKDRIGQLAILHSHPKWLIRNWISVYGEANTIKLLAFNNSYTEIYFRHNPLKIEWPQLRAKLDREMAVLSESELGNVRFFCVDRPGVLLKSPLFTEGACSVQDYSQALAVMLLNPQPGETILDVCAAPGGKTTMIAQLGSNRINLSAFDISEDKIALIQNECRRLGIDSVTLAVADAREAQFDMADKILVDAPCTGTGVIARRADIRWNRRPEDILKLNEIQTAILENTAGFVRPGGVLVYSTCSIQTEENDDIVAAFLGRHPEFQIDPAENYVDRKYCDESRSMRILPFQHNMTGGFAVRLLKKEHSDRN